MTLPEEHLTLFSWFNQVVGDLGEHNMDLGVFQKYWGNLTAGQQDQMKNLTKGKIDDAIEELNLIKLEIDEI